MSLAEDLARCLRQLAPESCPRCGRHSRCGFCRDCRHDFVRIARPCPRCALPQPCRGCPAAAPDWQLQGMRAPFVYAPPLAAFIRRLKYARYRPLGRALGAMLASEIADDGADADLIVPVPLHPQRLRERHFNQADEIARPLAAQLGLPLAHSLVRRIRPTAPQAGLDRRERRRSVGQAFELAGSAAGARIAIVDDVVTTGATVNAIAATLLSAGAARVSVLAVARALDLGEPADQPAPNR